MIPLTIPETRRLALALGAPAARCAFGFGRSRRRRGHQAVAARCHAARHARTRGQSANDRTILPAALARGAVTDAGWERVRLVLPPQQPRTGRRRHDHRTILSGIVTVVGTELSWREIPEAYEMGDGVQALSAPVRRRTLVSHHGCPPSQDTEVTL